MAKPLEDWTHNRPLENKRDFQCLLLAAAGQSYEAIGRLTGLNKNQIAYRIARARPAMLKLHMTSGDYRAGRSPFCRVVIEAAVRRMVAPVTQGLRSLQWNQPEV